MAKVQLTESQIIDLVENATRKALTKMLGEGAGWDAVKAGAKEGFNSDGKFDKERAKDFIKNGENGTNYEEYKRNKKDYEGSKSGNENAKKANRDIKKNPDSYSSENAAKSNNRVKETQKRRDDNALATVSSRPGVIGKAQRAASVGGAVVGNAAKKVKDAGKDFLHNKIGLEEGLNDKKNPSPKEPVTNNIKQSGKPANPVKKGMRDKSHDFTEKFEKPEFKKGPRDTSNDYK